MDAVTYPDPRTIEFVNKNLIAFRVDANQGTEFVIRFEVQYTPTEIILDGEGKEHHRSVGYLPPEEFIPHLMLGMAKSKFNKDRCFQSLEILRRLLADYPGSKAAAEAAELKRACHARGY